MMFTEDLFSLYNMYTFMKTDQNYRADLGIDARPPHGGYSSKKKKKEPFDCIT